MREMYKSENRWILSVITAILAVSLLGGVMRYSPGGDMMAWWGSIYPEFCFQEVNNETENDEQNTSEHRPKISFWLAKALERW